MSALLLIVLAASVASRGVLSATPEKTGKEVVDGACIACHGSGVNGAPRIGDEKAWSKRAAHGLTSLTANAIRGIRQMPAHGGNPGLTDFEIESAVTYMVNQSGGHWVEPINKAAAATERSGEQIVRAQCAKCHESGAGGAPKIGDRTAWIPRVKLGLDTLVRSAINGHGGMPPRGGAANLTDAEMRSAVIYMFNAGTSQARIPAAATGGEDYRIVEGMTVYLGVIPASVIREHAKDYPASVSATVVSGPEQRYVTIALFDARSGERITDAVVSARVIGTTQASAEKSLKPVTVAGALTYGDYFPMQGGGTYKVAVHIHRPATPNVILAEFQYATQ